MTSQSGDTATGTSEETEPQGEENEQTQSQSTSLADSLMAVAKAEGMEVGDTPQTPGDAPPAKPEATEETETETEPETEDETEGDGQEQRPAAVERKSIEDQIAEAKAKGEKPAWYLTRIAEESDKRRRKDSELETVRSDLAAARQEAQAYQAQLAQASAPRPTPQQPLADLYTEPDIQRVEQSYEKILEFAETNRDGATDVVVGRDKDGNPIKQDFSPEEIAQLRVRSERALRKDIPLRRQFIAARAQADSAALEAYPEFKDPKNPMTQEAIAVLKMNPQLEQIVGPEILVWIGHALKGRDTFLKRSSVNGKNGNTETRKIVESATQRIAPTPPKTRSSFERKSGADLAQLNKQLEENGDEESAMKLLEATFASRGRAKVSV
jgi:hypothetical protein